MPITPEMHVLYAEIGGDQDFMAFRNPQDSTIISDAGYHRISAAHGPANLSNEPSLAKWHANDYIAALSSSDCPTSEVHPTLTLVICPYGHRQLPCLGNPQMSSGRLTHRRGFVKFSSQKITEIAEEKCRSENQLATKAIVVFTCLPSISGRAVCI